MLSLRILKKPSEDDFENLTDINISLSPFEKKEKKLAN
jgi:hypothetical protein